MYLSPTISIFLCTSMPIYFSHYASLNEAQATQTAANIWDTINQVNLTRNILPTKNRARLILHKGVDHSIDSVRLRKM